MNYAAVGIVLTFVLGLLGYAVRQTKWQTEHSLILANVLKTLRSMQRRLSAIEKKLEMFGEGGDDNDDSTTDSSLRWRNHISNWCCYGWCCSSNSRTQVKEWIFTMTELIDAAHHSRALSASLHNHVLTRGVDAAYPTGTPPNNAQIIAGYIGGPTALHTWSPQLFNKYFNQNHAYRFLSIWVDSQCSYPSGGESGKAAVAAALKYGWAADMPGDQRRWIAVDAETNTNYTYYSQCATAIWNGGFRMLAYRSLSSQGPVSDDLLWAADWTNNRPASIPWAGQQYAAGVTWDQSVFTDSVFNGCGRGARHVF